jgi:hypothetical protein
MHILGGLDLSRRRSRAEHGRASFPKERRGGIDFAKLLSITGLRVMMPAVILVMVTGIFGVVDTVFKPGAG